MQRRARWRRQIGSCLLHLTRRSQYVPTRAPARAERCLASLRSMRGNIRLAELVGGGVMCERCELRRAGPSYSGGAVSMATRMNATRWVGLTVFAGLALASVMTVPGIRVRAVEPPPAPRGNPPGEWRYWGADAWSTRYSPLDQINGTNFNSLKIAWRWTAGNTF